MDARWTEEQLAEYVNKHPRALKSNPLSPVPKVVAVQSSPASHEVKKDYKAQFLDQLQVASLPAPEMEVRFHPVRKWRFDFAWPDRKVAVEYQGGVFYGGIGHNGIKGVKRDCLKFSSAVALGWRLFLINADMVRDGTAFSFLQDALTENP